MPAPRSIVLDAQGAQNRAHFDRGIPRYVTEQLRAVLAAAPELVEAVALNPAPAAVGQSAVAARHRARALERARACARRTRPRSTT